MAAAVPILMAASTAFQVYSYRQSAKRAKNLATYNAKMKALETEEAIRRQKKVDRYNEALARARANASGVKVSGSVSEYLAKMEEENLSNIDWMRRSGSSQVGAIVAEGSYAAKQANLNAVGSAISGANQFAQWTTTDAGKAWMSS